MSRFLSSIYSLGEKRFIWLVFWILFNTCLIPTLDAAVWIHFWWNIILVISLDFSSHEVSCIQFSNKKQTWIVPGRDQLKITHFCVHMKVWTAIFLQAILQVKRKKCLTKKEKTMTCKVKISPKYSISYKHSWS